MVTTPKKSCEYSLDMKNKNLKVNCEKCIYSPDLAASPICMARTINKLMEVGQVNEIIFLQKENYIYDFAQAHMLFQIANLLNELVHRRNILDYSAIGAGKGCERCYPSRYDLLRVLVMYELREDPIGAYLHVIEQIKKEEIKAKTPLFEQCPGCYQTFINTLTYIRDSLANTDLIKAATPYLKEYDPDTREVYKKILKPIIKPNFLYVKLTTDYPAKAEEIEAYSLPDKSNVVILKTPDEIRPIYHITPPEFKLTEIKYDLVGRAREVIAEHKPKKSEFVDPERTRDIFLSVAKDLLEDMSKARKLKVSYEELEELANVLVRNTIGFGIIEVLLSDDKIQDISINSPAGVNPITIIHEDFGECLTNITITPRDMESMATKLRMISGRVLDEANPVLDTQLIVPGGTARVAAIQNPLSPSGLAYAFRRHRSKPWTTPLFIDNKMISPLAAGLLSFIIDGARTLLIAGTRSAGKTSLLSSLLVEIMRANRIITVEDSVTGDSRIVVKQGDKIKRTTIGELIDSLIEKHGCENKFDREIIRKNLDNIEVLSMNPEGKQIFAPASLFMRHKVSKDIYEVETATGRRIKVTGDHSLFGLGDKEVFSKVKCSKLKLGDFIAVPRVLNINPNQVKCINLLEHLDQLEEFYISGIEISELVTKEWNKIKKLAKSRGYSRSMPSAWKRGSILPVKILKEFKSEHKLDPKNLSIKAKVQSKNIPVLIELNKSLLNFIGLWIADGCYDQRSIIMSVSSSEEQTLVNKIAEQFSINIKKHSDNFSLMLNSIVLKKIMHNVLKLRGNAYTKRVPDWIYSLSNEQIANVLQGLFSGDGCAGSKEVVISLSSEQLLYDIQTLLLYFGIILRKRNKMRPDKTYNSSISALKFLKIFQDKIGFLQQYKRDKLSILCSKISTHDSSDIIPLSNVAKLELSQLFKSRLFNRNDYLSRASNIGREKLYNLLSSYSGQESLNPLKQLSESDIFWDKIISMKKLESSGYVYDISVPGCENFICENILAHNTLELPVPQLKSLGYDVQSMKVQSVITGGKAEVSAAEGIRTSLRLGDSCLIVGEVRGPETLALYEAMRVGALANVVAGTIHGDSPYGVFDRIVNDLKVPKTSFKATDIVVICNPVKSVSGLEKVRRVTQITEVRKQWTDDPMAEHAFVDLMIYNPKTDMLEPTDALIQGESEIIKAIAGRVREWAGDWDAVWNNINLRMKIKQAIVDASSKKPSLMEADFVIAANDEFHKITERIRKETGKSDPEKIFDEWSDWLKKSK